MRRAVIDIGTNTVKLFVADVRDGNVLPVFATDKTTRLGEGLHQCGKLSPAAIGRTVATISDYIRDAGKQGAAEIITLSTAAARDALNGDEFLQAVRQQCRQEVAIITGQREAELIFRGIASDPAFTGQALLGLDVGGGSAEFTQGKDGKLESWVCLPVGAVRLTEMLGDNFTKVCAHLRRELPAKLAGFNAGNRKMVATGGGITTLARMAHNPTDHARFTLAELRSWGERLSALPLVERKKVPGLPPERADIIVAGGAVYVVAMEILGAKTLTVSVRNLRYGALL